MRQDNIYDPVIHDPLFKKGYDILHPCDKSLLSDQMKINIHEAFDLHLWESFQAIAVYPRSISMVMPVVVTYDHPAEQDKTFLKFHADCSQRMPDKLLTLNAVGDNRIVMKNVVTSYKETVDTHVIDKLLELQEKKGLSLNDNFCRIIKLVDKTCVPFS